MENAADDDVRRDEAYSSSSPTPFAAELQSKAKWATEVGPQDEIRSTVAEGTISHDVINSVAADNGDTVADAGDCTRDNEADAVKTIPIQEWCDMQHEMDAMKSQIEFLLEANVQQNVQTRTQWPTPQYQPYQYYPQYYMPEGYGIAPYLAMSNPFTPIAQNDYFNTGSISAQMERQKNTRGNSARVSIPPGFAFDQAGHGDTASYGSEIDDLNVTYPVDQNDIEGDLANEAEEKAPKVRFDVSERSEEDVGLTFAANSSSKTHREYLLPSIYASNPHEEAIPQLKRVLWEDFNKNTQRDMKFFREMFAVNVLMEEPNIVFRSKASIAHDRKIGSRISADILSSQQHVNPMEPLKNQERWETRWESRLDLEPKSLDSNTLRYRSFDHSPLAERIRIESSKILKVLGSIDASFLPYVGSPLVITRPYRCLIVHEERIRDWVHETEHKLQVEQSEDGSVGENHQRLKLATDLEHMKCLLEFMDTDLYDRIKFIRDPQCQKVFFSDIWHLFKPGDEVIHYTHGPPQVLKVLGVTSSEHRAVRPYSQTAEDSMPVTVHCVYIDFDGSQLGPVVANLEIPRFNGQRAIASLPIRPFYHQGNQTLRTELIERGKKFATMLKFRPMHYFGATLGDRKDLEGGVVVDQELAYSIHQRWKPQVQNLTGMSWDSGIDTQPCIEDCCQAQVVLKDGAMERARNTEYFTDLMPHDRSSIPSLVILPRGVDEENETEASISDAEFLIMSCMVCGYDLNNRKWEILDISKLSPMFPDDSVDNESEVPHHEQTFDQLVIPKGHKDMIVSLVAQHFKQKHLPPTDYEDVDFIRGKGKGLVILLHGSPGVGKTSTAECVAEYFKKPLYPLMSGDLGAWAKDVEDGLAKNFSLASRWGCILLIDEADIFLAARTPTDHIRNGLISGLLFIVTNRVGDFDEAFTSRIHMSIYYPPLDKDSTMAIFQLNLGRIKKRFQRMNRKINIEDVAIGGYAMDYWTKNPKARWNGHHIRNACQTALALAEFDAQDRKSKLPGAVVELGVKYFERVAHSYLGFMSYMSEIYGIDDHERAKENFLRAKPEDPLGHKPPNPLAMRANRPSQELGGYAQNLASTPTRMFDTGIRSHLVSPRLHNNQNESNMTQNSSHNQPLQSHSSNGYHPSQNRGPSWASETPSETYLPSRDGFSNDPNCDFQFDFPGSRKDFH